MSRNKMKPYPLVEELLCPILRVAMPRPPRLWFSRRPVMRIPVSA